MFKMTSIRCLLFFILQKKVGRSLNRLWGILFLSFGYFGIQLNVICQVYPDRGLQTGIHFHRFKLNSVMQSFMTFLKFICQYGITIFPDSRIVMFTVFYLMCYWFTRDRRAGKQGRRHTPIHPRGQQFQSPATTNTNKHFDTIYNKQSICVYNLYNIFYYSCKTIFILSHQIDLSTKALHKIAISVDNGGKHEIYSTHTFYYWNICTVFLAN